ncbi:MAG: citramalate synthase [Oscillospiraceae bacterium]|jgi:2-isopropylmalate synthase|nr:citramalate synthase [Oscillospiraceae bacterium]
MPLKNRDVKIEILDSTLRDGAQGEGISFSVADKLACAKLLSKLGVTYIEAGNPASNPKDKEFFERLCSDELTPSKAVAFGSTRRKGISCEEDAALSALLSADTDIVCIFGKSSQSQVEDVLGCSLEENLLMIEESCRYLSNNGKRVFFDAEHFFAGFIESRAYAISCAKAAARGGADTIVLCDTTGGMMPDDIYSITKAAAEELSGVRLGIHCHNDNGLAAANSISAVLAGAVHIQGTLLGIGERCGNTNLATVIANLQLRKGYDIISPEALSNLTPIAREMAEICNITIERSEPYIGYSAFAHKAGMHIDAVLKNPRSFEFIDPSVVGNTRRVLLSEISGRSAIAEKIRGIAPDFDKNSGKIREITEKIKNREHKGYEFEGAEASFEILVRRILFGKEKFFELVKYRVTSEKPYEVGCSANAMVKLSVGGEVVLRCAEGDGPVNALDKALRNALEVFYPQLHTMHLVDYKVRVMDSAQATASMVRVLITSSDSTETWTTVGVGSDIIEASFKALCDSVEYKLITLERTTE